MINITNVDVTGWEAAIRGMRNPLNSWEHSDSEFHIIPNDDSVECRWIGQDDLALMKKLAAAGPDHAKYRRMIVVTAGIVTTALISAYSKGWRSDGDVE